MLLRPSGWLILKIKSLNVSRGGGGGGGLVRPSIMEMNWEQ